MVSSPGELREALATQPKSWSQIIAIRIALRALPFSVLPLKRDPQNRIPLAIFRATFISWSGTNHRSTNLVDAADRARIMADTGGAVASAAAYAALATAYTANSADYAAYTADKGYAITRSNRSPAIRAAEYEAFYETISADLMRLANAEVPTDLASQNLWPDKTPSSWSRLWSNEKSSLLKEEPTFAVWTDWFDRRIVGKRAAFDIPSDIGRKEDNSLIERIASAPDESFWDQNVAQINSQLTEWLEDARKRATKNLIDGPMPEPASRSEKIARIRTIASPEFIENKGKADAAPHSRYDIPKFGGNLADLPTTLQSLARTLGASLPTQASPLVQSGLSEYELELKLRGPRPILGLLKGQIDGIASEIFTKASLAQSDDPSHWAFIDESEWGPGASQMFRTLFSYHNDLMEHFPLDEQREAVLRETEIEEGAATGKALTEPFETLAELVRDLHAQGMATDNILRVVEALAEHTRHVADLPTPPPGLPDDYISPQKRATLNNTGLLYEFYAFLGTSASLASWVQANQPLMQQLNDATFEISKLIP